MDDQFKEIVAEILQVTLGEIHRDLTPESVDHWDSLNHLRLITEVEGQYGVRFSMTEIQGIDSLGALQDLLSSHGGSR